LAIFIELTLFSAKYFNFACGLYECGIWSLTLREERRLRLLENRVLRRIFGPRWVEVEGE